MILSLSQIEKTLMILSTEGILSVGDEISSEEFCNGFSCVSHAANGRIFPLFPRHPKAMSTFYNSKINPSLVAPSGRESSLEQAKPVMIQVVNVGLDDEPC